MKICFISNLYPPFILGGAEISGKQTVEGLERSGYDVIVITTSPNRSGFMETKNGVKIYRINPLNLYTMYNHQNQPEIIKPIWHIIDLWNPHSYFIVKKILKKEMPDVVHINNFKGISLSVFSAVKRLNLPLIFTAHDYSLLCPRANLLHSSGEICTKPPILCKLYAKAQKYLVDNKPDLVTAPSQFVLDTLKARGLFGSVKVMKVSNAIELHDVMVEKDYETLDILYVGGLSRHKGVHLLINAFKGLKSENIKIHIVGKGKDEDEFKRLAGSDKRIFFHGFVPDNELMQLYREANVTVVPSIWYDNSPMVIYESFMRGTPVIGSRIGGIPELVEDGYNGFLFEPGNTEQLKTILAGLSEDSAKLEELSINAFNSAKNYEVGRHIKKLTEIYKGLMR